MATEFKAKGYSVKDAFDHLDTNTSGTITLGELADAFKVMKLQLSSQTLKNILHLFDVNGDNCISLEEFEKQMSKYMGGSAVTGRAEFITNSKQITGNIIPDKMKEDLVQDMLREQKGKVKFEDFSLKTSALTGAEKTRKEQMLLDQIKRGELASEILNGELKLQFEEGVDLLTVPGKTVPYISLVVVSYTAAEGRSEQILNS